MRKSFKYRLYPTSQQKAALNAMLDAHRHLYNDALFERKQAWEQDQRSVTYGQQSASLKDTRKADDFLIKTNFSSCQATLRRLDKSFTAFFRRVKYGEAPGYPRFKGGNRFNSVTFPSLGDGCKFDAVRHQVYFQHIGLVKVKLHRAVIGDIKTASFKREADGWYVVFSCDIGEVITKPSDNPAVGIDLGLKSFLVSSEGEVVVPPKFYRQSQEKLRRSQRAVSRKKKGSQRRRKAVRQVARLHQHVGNQRSDWHHKLSRSLVGRYGAIFHEDLNIKGIARTRLAKSTLDAAWGQFVNILHYKAEEAGVQAIAVNPRNTTQACSQCGCLPEVPLTLRDRVYHCLHCDYTADRDENAAHNILRLGTNLLSSKPPGLGGQALTGRIRSVA